MTQFGRSFAATICALSVSAQIIVDGPASGASPAWVAVALPSVGTSAQVVSSAKAVDADGQPMWILGGATSPAPPDRAPAVWMAHGLTSSNQSLLFAAVPMTPLPGYGQIAEIFGVAAADVVDVVDAQTGDAEIVAVGQAFGGAHGNPRTASWNGSTAGLSEVRANFELYNGPRQISVRGITYANGIYAIIGSRVNRNGRLGAAAWTSTDGSEFVLHDDDRALSSAPNEQVQALAVSVADSDTGPVFVAGGERLWWDPANSADTIGTDAVLWRSANGVRWERWSPPGFGLGGAGEQRITAVAQGGGQFAVAGTETVNGRVRAVFWSADGKRVISVLGSNTDPLSAVTSLARVGDWWVIGARMDGVLKLAARRDAGPKKRAGVWQRLDFPPRGVPTGSRARVLVLPETSDELWIGLSGLNGGGLWHRPLK